MLFPSSSSSPGRISSSPISRAPVAWSLQGDPDRPRRHWTATGGTVRPRPARRRLRRRRPQRRAGVLAGRVEGVQEELAATAARASARTRRRGDQDDAAADRHDRPLPRSARTDRPREVPPPRVGARAPRGRRRHRRVYDCRHTFASWAIAGGVSLFHLSKIMGTSTTMIGEVYGHLLPDSEDYLRGLLDTTTTPRRRQQEPHDELRRAHENVAPLQGRP
jgi:hypothetical protein